MLIYINKWKSWMNNEQTIYSVKKKNTEKKPKKINCKFLILLLVLNQNLSAVRPWKIRSNDDSIHPSLGQNLS